MKSGISPPDGGALVLVKNSRDAGDDCLASDVFDPGTLLKCGGRFVDDMLDIVIGFHAGGKIRVKLLESEGNGSVVAWTLRSGDEMTASLKPSNGLLLLHELHIRTPNGTTITESYEFSHDETSGVVYSSRYNHASHAENTRRHIRSVSVSDSTFDQPVDPSSFSYAAFGVRDGDQLYDELENRQFVFLDGKPVRPEDFMDELTDAVTPGRQRLFFLGNVAGFFTFLFLYVYARKRASSRSRKQVS